MKPRNKDVQLMTTMEVVLNICKIGAIYAAEIATSISAFIAEDADAVSFKSRAKKAKADFN